MIVKMFLITFLLAAQLLPDKPQTGTLTIDFSGIDQQKGYVHISVFNDYKGFPNTTESVVKTIRIKAEKSNEPIQISNLPFGEYALSCYHDANGNKKLDTNFFGIPKEKVGASNNPPSGSIPSYKAAKFVLQSRNFSTSIHLH